MSLKDKVALITSGSRSIRRAITLKLASEGADVVINYFRKQDTAELTAQEAREKGVKAHIIKADGGNEEDGGKMVSISSLGSQLIMPIYTAVGVSKAALEALTRYLAIELAPKRICVNGVSAAAVETEALKLYTGDQAPPQLWNTTPRRGEWFSRRISLMWWPSFAVTRRP
jgi:NAD(P)-dependent dehydrogenase (short-subunit alcohol dehydrogenase family)